MTKKNILHVIDVCFWLLIAVFPIIAYLVCCINNANLGSFADFLTNMGFGISTSSPLYIAINQIFAVGGGFLEITTNTGIITYAVYFATIMIVHFVLDVLLILIRWGHQLINKATKE